MLRGSKITLLVSGSIAAYKSAELVREFVKRGASVQVAMSKAACEFITPLTMQTLSGHVVTTDLFDAEREAEIDHIALADEADVVVVAPATASCIAKAANGMADDAITTVLLAATSTKVIAPAMNVNMWENQLTKNNVATLEEQGFVFVEPESGELACGWQGAGRLAELSAIVAATEKALSAKTSTARGSRFIVSAGPTQESIDPIRFISNRSSGKMGFELAAAARRAGAEVVLIAGPNNLRSLTGVEQYDVRTAAEMRERVFAEVSKPFSGRQYVVMAAAVTDHRPSDVSAQKVKKSKTETYSLELEPCPDILSDLGQSKEQLEKKSGSSITIVGFAAETSEVDTMLASAKEKLIRKKSQIIVANRASSSFEQDSNHVWFISDGAKAKELKTAPKRKIAEQLIELIVAEQSS